LPVSKARWIKVATKCCTFAGLILLSYGMALVLVPLAYQLQLSANSVPERRSTLGNASLTKQLPQGARARLSCKRLGKALFVLPDVEGNLLKGPVWLNGTAEAGMGNSILAAHRDTHFRFLKDIRKGDIFRLETASKTLNYRVIATKVVNPEDIQLLEPQPSSVLTLVTCYPFYYIGSAPQRFIVRAAQVVPGTYQSKQKIVVKVSTGVVQ